MKNAPMRTRKITELRDISARKDVAQETLGAGIVRGDNGYNHNNGDTENLHYKLSYSK